MAIIVLEVAALAGRAEAGNVEEARAYLEKATAEYALYRYAAAAEHFEKAFELKPDPALLYDAAQSYRLAGNLERALALYESYLHVYPTDSRRPEIEAHIRQLRLAMGQDRVPASPAMLTRSADDRPNKEPLTKKPWFWGAVGGAAVAAILVVLLTSGGSNPASASLGRVSGN